MADPNDAAAVAKKAQTVAAVKTLPIISVNPLFIDSLFGYASAGAVGR